MCISYIKDSAFLAGVNINIYITKKNEYLHKKMDLLIKI